MDDGRSMLYLGLVHLLARERPAALGRLMAFLLGHASRDADGGDVI